MVAADFEPVRLASRIEALLDPPVESDAATLDALHAWLGAQLSASRRAALDRAGAFPEAELSALLRGPVGAALAPADLGGTLCWSRLMRVCARLAATDLGVTLCLGGVVLGALPVLVAGDEAQRRAVFSGVREGALCALGLSEWAHGSDLLAGQTAAAPSASGALCVTGEKRPINNASRARFVVILARTSDADDPFGASLLLLDRERHAMTSEPVPWVGYPGLDLGSVGLDEVAVDDADVLGAVGEGFLHARRTLEISRSGVAAMASGAALGALAHGVAHAQRRALYGAPIAELAAVRRLLGRCFGRAIVATALARRAAQEAGRAGPEARALTCAAKLVCPALAERNVHDAGAVLGARSLVAAHPFSRLRRDVPVLAIFDGSSELMRDELWRHAARWPAPDADEAGDWLPWLRAGRGERPARFDAHADDGGALRRASPSATLRHLAARLPELSLSPWVSAAERLQAVAGDARGEDDLYRFTLSDAVAEVSAVASCAEALVLAEPEARRIGGVALSAHLCARAPALARDLVRLGEGSLGAELLATCAGQAAAERRAAEVALALAES